VLIGQFSSTLINLKLQWLNRKANNNKELRHSRRQTLKEMGVNNLEGINTNATVKEKGPRRHSNPQVWAIKQFCAIQGGLIQESISIFWQSQEAYQIRLYTFARATR